MEPGRTICGRRNGGGTPGPDSADVVELGERKRGDLNAAAAIPQLLYGRVAATLAVCAPPSGVSSRNCSGCGFLILVVVLLCAASRQRFFPAVVCGRREPLTR